MHVTKREKAQALKNKIKMKQNKVAPPVTIKVMWKVPL